MAVNDSLRTLTIQHAHFIEQYKTEEVKRVLALMNKADVSLRRQIVKKKGATSVITKNRLQAIREDIKESIKDSKLILKERLENTALEFGKFETLWLGDIIKVTVPSDIPVSLVHATPSQILGAVRARPFNNTTLQSMVEEWGLKKKNVLINHVQQAFVQGQSLDDVVRTLFGTRAMNYTDALLDGTRREIRTQVRTALNHMSSTAREVTYEKNQDLIKGVQWVSTLDGRTTLLCMNLDGKVDLYDGSVRELNGMRPPAHYNCRSTTVPVLKSLQEMGISEEGFTPSTRASMNGQVAETKTYATWFKDQPKKFQKQVLGAKRYELYNSGELTLDKFLDNGRTLTIKELYSKYDLSSGSSK